MSEADMSISSPYAGEGIREQELTPGARNRVDEEEVGVNQRVNPFEITHLRNLSRPVWSPSVFPPPGAPLPLPTTPEAGFRWDIHEKAELWPKDLDESPSSHTNPLPVDSATEAQAQEDIERFFASGPIVPTPDDVVRQRHVFFRAAAPVPPAPRPTNTSWTNTELSLPPQLPPQLMDALMPYFQVDVVSETEVGGKERGSSEKARHPRIDRTLYGSVRRKLELSFGENGSTPQPRTPGTAAHLASNGVYYDPFGGDHCALSDEELSGSGPNFSGSPDEDMDQGHGYHGRRGECTPVASKRYKQSVQTPNLTPIRFN